MNKSYKNLTGTYVRIAVYRVFSVVLNLLSTALLVKILGIEMFGTYTAIFSIIAWALLMDMGIGKGLRNHVTVSLTQQNRIEARRLISSAYISSLMLALIFILACSVVFLFAPEIVSLNAPASVERRDLIYFCWIMSIILALRFYLSLLDQILYASHQSDIVALSSLITTIIFTVILLFLMVTSHQPNLALVASGFCLSLLLGYCVIYFWFFKSNSDLIPTIQLFSLKKFRVLFTTGYKIFLIQIGFFLIFGLDRLILLNYSNPTDAAMYDILYKLMTVLLFPFTVLSQPLWSSFITAFQKNDTPWIRTVYLKLYVIILAMFVGSIFISIFTNQITEIWLGENFAIKFHTAFMMGIVMLLFIWSNLHSEFLLGNGMIRVESACVLAGVTVKYAFLFIIFQTSHINLDVAIFSSILGYLFIAFVAPLYIRLVLKARDQSQLRI